MNKFKKQCPKCGNPMCYTNKWNLNASIKNNRLCRTCGGKYKKKVIYTKKMRDERSNRVMGKKNPMYGMKGELHPMYGKSGVLSPTYGIEAWNKGKENCFSKETRKKMKMAKKAVKKWKGKRNPNYGNHSPLSEEHRRKVRLAHIHRIEQLKLNGHHLKPGFNIDACKIIDEYGKTNGYKFQHAMNSGEYFIDYLGYWVDGYDKEKNVVIEYYEDDHHHYNKDGTMKEKDVRRINEIKQYLKCKFIILEENKL